MSSPPRTNGMEHEKCPEQLARMHMFSVNYCERIRNDINLILETNQTLLKEYEKLYLEKKQLEQQYRDTTSLLWTCIMNLHNANNARQDTQSEQQSTINDSTFDTNAFGSCDNSSINQNLTSQPPQQPAKKVIKRKAAANNNKRQSAAATTTNKTNNLSSEPASIDQSRFNSMHNKPSLGSQPKFIQKSLLDFLKQE